MPAVTGKQLEPVSCGLCSFSSKRITSVEKHIEDEHGKTARQLYDELHQGPQLCKCGCGKETSWINWKVGYSSMLKGHNASIYAVYDEETAKEIAKTRGTNWRDKPGWSLGLTKETDERVKSRSEATSEGMKRAFSENKIEPWSKGLTKETDSRVAASAEALKQGYEDGTHVPWAQGLTKETDARVADMAAKVSLAHRASSLRHRLDKLKKLTADEVKSRIEDGGKFSVVGDLSDYTNDATPNIYVVCNTCGDKTHSSLRKLKHHRCYACDPSGSAMQASLADFVESLGAGVERNIRNVIPGTHRGAELDVYVSDKRVALEFNGLYWHCNIHKSDNYHQHKSDLCSERGIKLVHVFQDEWQEKRDIVESIVKHKLGMTKDRVGARKCSIVSLSPAEKRAFFEANHIDGDTASTHAIGLKHKEEVIMAVSLRHPFHKKHRDSAIEIARIATKLDTSVAGGLGRLTKEAAAWSRANGYSKLISYIDTRHGSDDGSSWISAGWTVASVTPPRFWWTDCTHRFNRFKFKADKKNGMTEAQVAESAGVVKIYGCKNLVLELAT